MGAVIECLLQPVARRAAAPGFVMGEHDRRRSRETLRPLPQSSQAPSPGAVDDHDSGQRTGRVGTHVSARSSPAASGLTSILRWLESSCVLLRCGVGRGGERERRAASRNRTKRVSSGQSVRSDSRRTYGSRIAAQLGSDRIELVDGTGSVAPPTNEVFCHAVGARRRPRARQGCDRPLAGRRRARADPLRGLRRPTSAAPGRSAARGARGSPRSAAPARRSRTSRAAADGTSSSPGSSRAAVRTRRQLPGRGLRAARRARAGAGGREPAGRGDL